LKEDNKDLKLQSLGSADIVDGYLTEGSNIKVSLVVLLWLLLGVTLMLDKYNDYLLTFPLVLTLMPVVFIYFILAVLDYKHAVYVRGLVMSSKLNRNTLVTLLTLVKSNTSIYYCESLVASNLASDLAISDNLLFKDNRFYYVFGYDPKTLTHVKLPFDVKSGQLVVI
jgi:hypothetical protein